MNFWLLVQHLLLKLSLMDLNESAFETAASGGPYTSIPGGDTGTIINFYINWRNYLHLNWGFLHSVAGWIETPVLKFFYHVGNSFQKIFDAMFGLLGWDRNGSQLGGLYTLFQVIGWSLLTIGIILVAIESLNHETKWSQIIPNILMVSLMMTVLPMLMSMASNIAVQAENGVKEANSKQMTSDLALQPIKNNVIDLSTLIRADFGGSGGAFTYKPDSNAIRDTANWNVIKNEQDVDNMDLGQYLDKDTMDKELKLDKHKAAEEAMKYHLEDESGQNGGGYIIAKNVAGAGAGTLNDQTYSRYSVNWIGVLGQELVLCAVLVIASLKVVEDIFELSIMQLIAPLLAYRSIRSSKKMRDLFSSIVGMFTSLVMILAIVKIYFIFIEIAPSKLPAFNWVERSIAILLIYAGGAYAMLRGLAYLERVTGISQGLSDEAGQLLATGAMAGAAGGFVGNMAGKSMSTLGGFTSHNNAKSNSLLSGTNTSQSHGQSNNSSSANSGSNHSSQDSQNDAQSINSVNSNVPGQNNGMQQGESNTNNNGNNGLNGSPNDINGANADKVDQPTGGINMADTGEQGTDAGGIATDSVDSPEASGLDNGGESTSFEQEADSINNPDTGGINTKDGSAEESFSNTHYNNPNSLRDNGLSSAHSDEQRTNYGQQVQNVGNFVQHHSADIQHRSAGYLKNRNFNMSNSGNLHGRDSDDLD